MPTHIRIALAVITLALTPFVSAQSGDSSSKISATSSFGVPDDAAFASYEKVTKGVQPPKATHSPDPEYPKIPDDAEPRKATSSWCMCCARRMRRFRTARLTP